MNNKIELIEIKRNQTGSGILIENDGYISASIDGNKKLFESLKEGLDNNEWKVPNPFIVSAVFQKYGIKNANGRIYPEQVLKRQVELYLSKIRDNSSFGELNHPSSCQLADTQILTHKNGWKNIADVKYNEEILTLNEDGNIEIKPIIRKIEDNYSGKLIHIKGRLIDIKVTPNHKFPIYGRNHKFKGFYTAQDILDKKIPDQNHCYIPKTGEWNEIGDEYFVIKGLDKDEIKLIPQNYLKDKYKKDVKIPIDLWMKFMGIYLSEGDCSIANKRNVVHIFQKKEEICDEIKKMMDELPFEYTIKGKSCKCFSVYDMRLNKYLKQFGNCYTKYIPFDIKKQSKEMLRIFYDWFVMGDGRKRGKGKYQNTDDVFSTSKQMVMDLNEIQLKIGYCGSYHEEDRKHDRMIENRLIKGENCQNMHFTLRSLTKGIYLDSRMLEITEEDYEGKVYCVEVENHTFYTMCNNGKCLWSGNSSIDGGRISHIIRELHWEGHTLVGKIELHLSPGYIKFGVISTMGDMAANLLLSGYKIGVSSRGVGSVEQNRMGQYIVGDDFELVCWDIVTDPSTPGAWIAPDMADLKPYMENKTEKDISLLEKIDKISSLLL